MNELIYKLRSQSYDEVPQGLQFNEKRFAKLIVKEVMQLSHNEENRFYDMNEDLLALVMENFRELIKEHFGVEEEHFEAEE
jgi:hypothetical protein